MATEEGQVIVCKSSNEFKDLVQKSIQDEILMVVDFTATWCPPCRFIAPIFAELAKQTPHAIFVKVDVDDLSDVSKEWSVEAMPTFLFLKEGKEVERIVGADKNGLETAVGKHGTRKT